MVSRKLVLNQHATHQLPRDKVPKFPAADKQVNFPSIVE